MARDWTLENTSAQFVSVKIRNAAGEIVRAVGFPPHSQKSVRFLFRMPDGSPDVEAAKVNEDVKQHVEQGRMKLFEREFDPKAANLGPLFNETDPEETRIQKILEYRRSLKAKAPEASKPSRKKE